MLPLLAASALGLLLVLAWGPGNHLEFAHRVYRNPDNWHIDGATKELRFHNWPNLGLCACFGIMSAITGYLTIS